MFISILLLAPAAPARGQRAQPSPTPAIPGAREVDRIAVRIEDDLILESEVSELAAYQELVEGKPEPHDKLIAELVDQWIVRREAETARFPQPTEGEITAQVERLRGAAGRAATFEAKLAQAGLDEGALRRIVREQIYLSRFLDYRFRPAAQVDDKQVEAYYHDTLGPQLAAKGEKLPPLESVQDEIRELLTEKDINDRAARWLDDARTRVKVDVRPEGND